MFRLSYTRQFNASGSLCVRLAVFLNLCKCVFVCVRVVCVAVPIVRWRSVRCAAVRRLLSSSLLALSQASRQLPEMQDSVLGKEILVLFPPPDPSFSSSSDPPPPTPSCYTQLLPRVLRTRPPSHTNPRVMTRLLVFLLGNHSSDVGTSRLNKN